MSRIADRTADRAAPRLDSNKLPWRRLVSPFRPVEILSARPRRTIHRASLQILAEVGVGVLGDRALDAFAAPATLHRSNRRVRLDPDRSGKR